jgi:hypothetical protein
MQTWRTLLAASAVLTILAIALQFFFIGLALTQLGGNGDASLHVNFGYLMPVFPLATLILCWPARSGRTLAILTAVLFVDSFVQGILPLLRPAFLAALHPVNAMVMAALAGIVIRQSMSLARASASSASTPTES